MKQIIFIAGIHGVGKTTFSKKINECIKINYYSCSNLIKKFKESDKNKLVENIDENQNALKLAMNKYISYNETILLDGHFSLLNINKEIELIPFETFKTISPKEIILLNESEHIILKRLNKKNNNIFSLNLIRDMQQKEISHATHISKLLSIPLSILNSNETGKAISIIHKYLI